MWSFPGSYANRGSRTEQASSDVSNPNTKDAGINDMSAGTLGMESNHPLLVIFKKDVYI